MEGSDVDGHGDWVAEVDPRETDGVVEQTDGHPQHGARPEQPLEHACRQGGNT